MSEASDVVEAVRQELIDLEPGCVEDIDLYADARRVLRAALEAAAGGDARGRSLTDRAYSYSCLLAVAYPHTPTKEGREMSENVVRVGSIIESEFGVGPVVAITKEWIVHEGEGGRESAIHREDMYWALLPDRVEEGPGPIEEIPAP